MDVTIPQLYKLPLIGLGFGFFNGRLWFVVTPAHNIKLRFSTRKKKSVMPINTFKLWALQVQLRYGNGMDLI